MDKLEEQQVRPLQQQLDQHVCPMRQQLEKLEEQFMKMERRWVTLVSNAWGGSESPPVVIGKFTTYKIPTLDGTGLRGQ